MTTIDGWEAPEGCVADRVGRCRSCGAEMLWVTTRAGRRAPYDRDGVSHFATCPTADRWRRPKVPLSSSTGGVSPRAIEEGEAG